DRGRRARDGLLLRDRARQEQGDAPDVHRRGVRVAPARIPLAEALRARAHLPGGRPRRPGDSDFTPARRNSGRVRRDDRDPGRHARRSVGAGQVTVEAAPQPAAPTATEYDVRLIGLTKRFDDVVAVDALSLDIDRGHFFALLGPSGCGKTTTLRMIGGFEEPTEGRIELGGVD